ncbi:hypothetical protein LIER_39796 [Lithospermum erythrorhizon]|uniref:DUF4283 domain-containing protein n=1 Tax=Lithospermum erythrorhizon TaxID=34254 RepID=A0AAV3QNB0_LITER
MTFEYTRPNGEDVELEEDDMIPIVAKWGYCLIGCFTGRFPGSKAVYDIAASWGVRNRVIPYSKGWTIFRFNSLEDREKVVRGGPYMAWGKTLMLKVVEEGMALDDDLFLDIPLWVKFYNVPLEFWNPKGLGKIASKLGRPLYSDQITNEYSRATYARILVEVDVRHEPIYDYNVRKPNGNCYTQIVSYENFPDYCYHCKVFKHGPEACNVLKKKKDLENNKGVHVEANTVGGEDARVHEPTAQPQASKTKGKEKADEPQGATSKGEGGSTSVHPKNRGGQPFGPKNQTQGPMKAPKTWVQVIPPSLNVITTPIVPLVTRSGVGVGALGRDGDQSGESDDGNGDRLMDPAEEPCQDGDHALDVNFLCTSSEMVGHGMALYNNNLVGSPDDVITCGDSRREGPQTLSVPP